MKIALASCAVALSVISLVSLSPPSYAQSVSVQQTASTTQPSKRPALQLGGTVTLTKKEGQSVDFCTPYGACVSHKLPVQLGPVTDIVQGEFIATDLANISWIARSDTTAHLCYIAKTNGRLGCTPINAPPVKHADITFTKINGVNAIVLMPNLSYDDKAKSRPRITSAMMTFVAALNESAQRLQARSRDEELSPTTIDNSGCADCPADGGGGGSGGDDGWGGGGEMSGPGGGPYTDGSFTCMPVGPTIVCGGGPPPPLTDPWDQPLPPGPSEPWYCSWLGIGCDDSSEPEPTNPPGGGTAPTLPPTPANPPVTQPPPKWTAEDELNKDYEVCYATYERDMDECSAYNSSFGAATYIACTRRAGDYLANCQTAARDKYNASKP